MKISSLLLLSLLYLSCGDNSAKPEKTASQDSLKVAAQSDYNLAIPTGWTVEKISFPIEFAPDINYKGVEDLRFAPGWGKKEISNTGRMLFCGG